MGEYFIHPSAIVEEPVCIGKGTKIWVNSQIRKGVRIGDNCIISKDTYIDEGVTIGNNCKIQNGVSIYHGVTIEDKVFIGPNAAFTNDMYPRAFSVEWEITDTLIKEGASIGANATIVCGTILGEYCMIGSGSVVTKDVPKQALFVGNPARLIGYVCKCGHRLGENGFCKKCNAKYDINSIY
ncbi:MAG: acyltransferase [Eubacteriales bacterium]|nr:acyltransferase [Eubacteriales bacterium]